MRRKNSDARSPKSRRRGEEGRGKEKGNRKGVGGRGMQTDLLERDPPLPGLPRPAQAHQHQAHSKRVVKTGCQWLAGPTPRHATPRHAASWLGPAWPHCPWLGRPVRGSARKATTRAGLAGHNQTTPTSPKHAAPLSDRGQGVTRLGAASQGGSRSTNAL